MIEEVYCLSLTVGIDIKNDKLVIGLLKEMTRQIKCHLRSCAVISAYVEAIDPDIAVVQVLKADIGVDTALRVKSSSEEARLVIFMRIILPFKARQIFERYRSC